MVLDRTDETSPSEHSFSIMGVGIALALIAFGFLHYLAAVPGEAGRFSFIAMPAGMSPYLGTFLRSLQFLVPTLIALWALSAFNRQREPAPLPEGWEDPAEWKTVEALPWATFSPLVAEMFQKKGFMVLQRADEKSARSAVDFELLEGRSRYLVHCRHWQAPKVTLEQVRALHRAMVDEHAVGGFFITCGTYSEEMRKYAGKRAIQFIHAGALLKRTRKASQRPSFKPRTLAQPCPICGGPMVLRRTSLTSRQQLSFWGCARFPDCRGSRDA